jgi:hypothetical protein
VGFNWDMSGTGTRQLRGGVGLFSGRTPYVWLSNQYGNTGVDFTSLSVSYLATNQIPFVADPNNQPTTVTGGTTGRQTINVIDPEYKYPSIIRSNLGFDHQLGIWGLIGTAELVYTNNVKEILYQNLNYVPLGKLPDGRTTYKKYDTNLNDVMLLSNTGNGNSWSISYKLEKPFKRGFYASGSYIYGDSKSMNDGTSSVARSNWANNPISIDTNMPDLARSNYAVGSRVNLAFTFPVPIYKQVKGSASIFYNGQNGRPYGLGFNGDANLDGATSNDLLFIPSSADQVVVYNGTYDQLDAWLNSTVAKDYRGQIMPRNAGRAPWQNQMDFRFTLGIPTGGRTKADLTFDVFNFLNLINKDWGWQYFGSFPQTNLVGYGGIDAATGKVRYNLATITSSSFIGTFTRDDLRSRYQAQVGLRFRF